MDTNHDSPLILKLADDLLQARKDGDAQKTEILQSVLTRITNAQAVAVENNAPATMGAGVGSTEAKRRILSEEEIQALIQQEIDELAQALEGMNAYPDHPYRTELKNKVAMLSRYI